MTFADEVVAGRPRAVARALSLVERGGSDADELLRLLRRTGRRCRSVGLTGSPGVGKSTLVQALGLLLAGRGQRVGVIAVDPSSPFSGGALLGDRVRMGELAAAGAFVRSMATRGALGGVTAATGDALDVLEAAGFEVVLVETVGVGQDEVDVAGVVDTVVVVTAPGLGDDVQAAKAGLFEVAHVFAVNKADAGSVASEVGAIEGTLALAPSTGWRPPVIAVSATTGDGVGVLLEALDAHARHLDLDSRRAELRRQRAERRLEKLVGAMVWKRVSANRGELLRAVDEVAAGGVSAEAAALRLLAGLPGEVR